MDLNQLYFEHQLLVIRAGRAPSRIGRGDCEADSSRLAERIGRIQRESGAGAATMWEALAGHARHSVAGSSQGHCS